VTELETAARLGVALVGGLAVGLEREWSGHASGPGARFAGVRTFFLLGGLGGIAGWLATPALALPGLAAALLVATGGLIVAAYLIAAKRSPEAIDGTTEAAALLVVGLGVLAGLGWIRIASGATAVVVLALGEKDAIRRFVTRIDDAEMRAALQFAVLALVVLPLLPAGPFGPYDAIRPRLIWTVVLLFSAINFLGYLARKFVGDDHGYWVMGALGGLISSTAVTLSFSRLSRRDPEHTAALSLGVVAACTILVPRVLTITAGLNPQFLPAAALVLVPMFAVGVVSLAHRKGTLRSEPSHPDVASRNPLDLGHAIRMAIAFQAVMLGIEAARSWFGRAGVVGAAAIAGLTDVDALTLSMARLAAEPDQRAEAAFALGVGVLANTLLKTSLVLFFGSPEFRRRTVPRLAAMAAALGLGLLLR
jgi:uncharacterized membrane protein (DUF4010 family)